jgi:YidC/Oxa1 family membrane protein insertase
MQNRDQMHPQDMRNLILFMVLSVALWMGYEHFIVTPKKEAMQSARVELQKQVASGAIKEEKILPREDVLTQTQRIKIDNPAVSGTINLKGARLDDLHLKNYFTAAGGKETVTLLSPASTDHPRYIELGWVPAEGNIKTPGADTPWQVAGNSTLSDKNPVTLRWDNGAGVVFERTISVDENYGFTVVQKVTNKTGAAIKLHPYALVTEHGIPADYSGRWVIHEGPIGFIGDELVEHSYKDVKNKGNDSYTADQGWIGITEKYWLSAIIPPAGEQATYRFTHTPPKTINGRDRYQSDVLGAPRAVGPGETVSAETRLFAGAKQLDLLGTYEKEWNVPHFDLAVDFGLFYFLTRPFAWLLHLFHSWVGNFGIAIMMLTLVVRSAVFPLANTSYRSFGKLRKVSPQMYNLRAQYKDDKQKLQEELVKLYQTEKVNPMAGCLPMLVQIPIFFALFKVLSNTLEMRQAPFFGWIQDLSAPDPTSVFNLFGLIPWDPPQMLMIGAWPCMMLVTMILQRKMNPPPQDKTQAMIINMMPWIMVYILASFASGLVIYWTFSNILAVIQQYIIMRSMGVEVHLFSKDTDNERMEEAVASGPSIHPEIEAAEEAVEEALFGDDKKPAPTGPVKPKKSKPKKK